MTRPEMDRDAERRLSAWMDAVAPESAPSRLLEGTFARTLRSRQARTRPWHRFDRPRLGLRGAGYGGRVLVLVVAGLVLALGLGLLAGGAIDRPKPTASPSPGASRGAGATPGATPPVTLGPLPSAIAIDPLAVIPVLDPIAIVASGSDMWTLGAGELKRIDPTTNTVTASVPLGGAADLYNDLAANAAGLWATDWDTAQLFRVDPATRKVVARIPAGLAPKGILATASGVWVADTHDGKLLRVDPATNTIVARITVGPTGNSGPNWLAEGLGSIWVNIPNNGTVVRVDPVSNAIQATIPIPPPVVPCGGFFFMPDVVWVTECSDARVMAGVDPASNTVTRTVDLGTGTGSAAMIDGALWFSVDTGESTTGRLVRIDTATNQVDRVLAPSRAFGGGGNLFVAGESVWALDAYNNAVVRFPLAAFGS